MTAWLSCEHTLTLDHRHSTGALKIEGGAFGEMAAMLLDKGEAHERHVLDRYRAKGLRVHEVPARITPENPTPTDSGRTSRDFPGGWEPFEACVERVGNPMASGEWDVVYQLPLIHEGVRGVADFLVRVADSPDDAPVYEAVDAKLVRTEAKPGHVLQLCFYADAVHALTGRRADTVTLELGSGKPETIRLADVEPYWRRLRKRLFEAMAAATTDAAPCSHCSFCDYAAVCDEEWRAADSLVFVNGLRSADRVTLVEQGVSTMTSLATADPIDDLDIAHVERHVRQDDLRVRTRALGEDAIPLVEIVPLDTTPIDGDGAPQPTGFAAMPKPSLGDVFLDFEGHPFWTAEAGLFFLFGLIERKPSTYTEVGKSATGDDADW